MKRLALLMPLALAIPLALAGCVTIRSVDDGISRATIGEAVVRDGVRIVPLTVVEDSRCPQGVACIQAGTVRITAEVDGSRTELALGRPVGRVTLVEVYPTRRKDTTYYPDEYRFGFKVTR